MQLAVMNMNKQPNLYQNDMRPIVRMVPSQPAWARSKSGVKFKVGHLPDRINLTHAATDLDQRSKKAVPNSLGSPI